MGLFGKKENKEVQKYQGVNDLTRLTVSQDETPKRGVNVYYLSQLMDLTARNKQGQMISATSENPYFFLTPEDRLMIFQLCPPIQGIVTSRAHRISGTKINIEPDKKVEDRIVEELRSKKQIWVEMGTQEGVEYKVARAQIYAQMKYYLSDLFLDMTNFETSLLRWKKKINFKKVDRCNEVLDWLQEPSNGVKWQDFVKQYIVDLHVHGTAAIYKEVLNDRLENLYILPGGTVIPLRSEFVTSAYGYVQIVSGYEPELYFADELSFSQYVPISEKSYGVIPLEALINKTTEYLLFDKRMADEADGTKPPEKAVIVTDNSPFGSADKDMLLPLDADEQMRIEKKLNDPIKTGVITLTGTNATVIDLSRENLMDLMTRRQEFLEKSMAMCFNMSNVEINQTGSSDTSGRSTSETQAEIDQGKGIIPIQKNIEVHFNQDILPFRFGDGYNLAFDITKSEVEKYDLLTKKKGFYTINEIRVNDLNEDPLEGDQYNEIEGQGKPDGSEQNPMFTKGIQ